MMQTMIVSDYKPILTQCFSADLDLLRLWHVESGLGLGACVDRTFKDMSSANVECHVVYEHQNLVGFFGKERAHNAIFLTGFFVMPERRDKDGLIEFWGLIKKELGSKFFCGLYGKNQPAIDFVTRNNAEPLASFAHEGESVVIYRIEEQLCQ